jgi:hypothetical protein
MGRWVELAKTTWEGSKPAQSPTGKFVDLDRASFVAVVQQPDQNGQPTDSWVVRTDQGALASATFGSEAEARGLLSELVDPVVVSASKPTPETGPSSKPMAATRKRT